MNQKMKKKILFICTENLERSPTAEELINNTSEFRNYIARSAGTSVTARNQITKGLVDWADLIFVFDEEHDRHKSILLERFPKLKKQIINLQIADDYFKNDPELIDVLKKKLKKYLN